MAEDVTQEYTKKFEQEQQEAGLDKSFNLDIEEDRQQLSEELSSNSMYFKPEKGVIYKIELTSPQVRQVEKDFEGKKVTKYEISIKATGDDKSEFEGVWETGKSVFEPIFKDYSKGATFLISKSGSGKDTRYSVVKNSFWG